MKKLIVAALAITLTGCATKKSATNYFNNHPEEFAAQCDRQFPNKLSSFLKTIPGQRIWVDCDSALAAIQNNSLTSTDDKNDSPKSANDGNTKPANAPGNAQSKAGRRAMVPVDCPPSTHEVIQVENTKAVEAAKHEASVQRTRAEDAEKSLYMWKRIALFSLGAIGLYILLRVLGSKISFLTRFIR